jgi:putrescine importer
MEEQKSGDMRVSGSAESGGTDASVDISKYGYKQEFERKMNVVHLTAFGLNYMVPIAPAIIFGFLLQTSGGTVALPYLIAGLAMLFTALSYSVMVRNFPLAGSVYNYVGRGWNVHLGFLSGWVLLLDYILIPTVTAASSAMYAQQLFPAIPFWVLLAIFSIGTGTLNLFGTQLLSKMGLLLLIIGEFVIFTAFIVWGKAVYGGVGTGTLLSTQPFEFSSFTGLISAASLAVFSYLGFDAITTLAEESKNPKRDIPRAIYWCIGIGTLTMFLSGYIGMLVFPDWKNYIMDQTWVNTTLFQVSKLTGGEGFSVFYTAGYLTSLGVFNLVATAAGARLLYGMGRDNLIPGRIFAKINKRWKTPHWNILIIVAFEFLLGLWSNLGKLSSLVNYGALAGFAMLNLSVIWLYYVKKQGHSPLKLGDQPNWMPSGLGHLRYTLLPFIGFLIILAIFISMDKLALILGTCWLIIGIIFLAIKTKGFKKLPPKLDLD